MRANMEPSYVSKSAVFNTKEVDLDTELFWKRARELGETVQRYGEELMEEAASHSKDVRNKIRELKDRMNVIVHGVTALHELQAATIKKRTRRSGDTGDKSLVAMNDMAGDLERAFEKVFEELKVLFPAPEKALGHEERQKVVAVALEKAGAALTTVCTRHGMDEERVAAHWETIRAAIEKLVVLLGDLVEQHPLMFETLLITFTVMLIPEYWVLRPLLRIFGFGPIGPVKGTAASWAQRVFYGAAVSKGSWFAYLEKAAMTLKAPGWWGWVGGLFGIGLGEGSLRAAGGANETVVASASVVYSFLM
ncbi:hypothetical protein MVEN_01208500 [Mycena venus]|uniref:Uncharacterized protein n=1 Tax=Mycena venus TaxID=2733690 RepID=A0A8H6Y4U1_9AGAR|nr:hypothetical protein MVEN_01208500 [Mycena venus]